MKELDYDERPHPTKPGLNHHGLPIGVLRLDENNVWDSHTGLTLEVCEHCGEYDEPQDDSYGLCRACIEAGFTPPLFL